MYFKINIPEPCGEIWHDMTPTEQGKFCASCEKEVIDFTNYTDSELANKLKKGEKLCGRFSTKQIDRDLFAPSEKRKTPWKLIASFTTLMAMAGGAFAQGEPALSYTQQENIKTKTDSIKKGAQTRVLEGLVVNPSAKPILGAIVQLKGTNHRITTDAKGKYRFEVPASIIEEKSILIFSHFGYEDEELKISESSICKMKNREDSLMGEVILVSHGQKPSANKN